MSDLREIDVEMPQRKRKVYKHLAVSPETFKMILEDVREEFLAHNPNYASEDMYITQDTLIRRIANYYLGRR